MQILRMLYKTQTKQGSKPHLVIVLDTKMTKIPKMPRSAKCISKTLSMLGNKKMPWLGLYTLLKISVIEKSTKRQQRKLY